jgi:bacillithiol biosynthesis cysteine-adding enzyme BshC
MELIVSHPTGGSVVRDYLDGRAEATRFYRRHFRDAADYASKAVEVDERFDRSARARAVEAVSTPPGADAYRLERFVEQGGYMVTTGQQPGLYGGPLYSIYKALTAVRLAEALESRLGKPVVPLFWVASDDHDWGEANHADLIGVDNELHRFELDPPSADRAPPLHRAVLGEEANEVLERFLGHLPETDFSRAYTDVLRAGYSAGGTLPKGFHAFMQETLGRFGLFFTDAVDPALKESTAGLLLDEMGRAAELEEVLRGTAAELTAAGYDLQVPILEGGVNLFLEGPAGRERLYRDGDGFRLRTSDTLLTRDQLLAARAADPSVLSPNVLLRPVVESALFPTLAYVGGPGEMAYFAQLGAYFEAHDVQMPVVYPRWSATPIESKIRKVLDKFGVDLESMDRPFHEIASHFARQEMPDAVGAALGKLRSAIGAGAGDLQKAVSSVDPTLKGPVQHFRAQAFAALDDVEKKVVQAVKRESEIALAQLEKAQLHLFPGGKPAERVQSPLYFLTRYGDTFLDELHERFTVNLE